MDLLKDKITKLYFKYLAAAFGSTLIISIYSLVDTIVIGRYEGPNGTAAVADFMPMWSIMFALGLLFGIGGSVLMAHRIGAGDKKEGNRYFTAAMVISIVVAAIIFIVYNFCMDPLLYLFGGRDEVLTLAGRYGFWIAWASPLFLLGQALIPFIRNDGHPGLTTASVMVGGIFNIFGDIFFVFGLDMGISGAGLATAIGQALAFLVLLGYMVSRKCTLRFDLSTFRGGFIKKCGQIISIGASNFVVDIAIAVLGVLINNQIMIYSGASALAIYGVITSLATMVQSFGYAVGESAQAIMSVNFGAGNNDRVLTTRRIASAAAFVIGILCCLAGVIFARGFINLYMTPTAEVLELGVPAIRVYFIALIFLVFNVSATYYFQSVNRPLISMAVSLARGIVLSAILVLILPHFLGIWGIWIAIPITEAAVAVFIGIKYRAVNFY